MNTLGRVRTADVDGIPVVAIEGEVDIGNVTHLRAQIVQSVPNAARGLVLDLTGTTYLDSRGVHLILELADRMTTSQQELRVVVPPDALIRRVLELTHVDAAVPLDPSVEAALSHFRRTLGERPGNLR
ncbi:MAG TPA: STAS domain-containing protein [bacterium]|nr:STAS domain-containing protein [bacterium]